MRIIEKALKLTNGYIKSFERDTVNGWWTLEMGLPLSWVYCETDVISCEIIIENDLGKLVKISPKNDDIVIDDLIDFVEIIITTNQKIAEKEKEFKNKMEEMKSMLEEQAKSFYTELDDLKEKSFNNVNYSLNKNNKSDNTTLKNVVTNDSEISDTVNE